MNLIIQTAFLGDLLLSVPLIKKLKDLEPTEPVGIVCRKGVGEVLVQLGLVDHLFEVSKGDSQSYSKALSEIKKHKIKYLICPHQSLRSAFFARKICAARKIGFSKWWNFNFFDTRISFNKNLPEALRQLSLLQDLDPQLPSLLREYEVSGAATTLDSSSKLSSVPSWGSMSQVEQLKERRPLMARVKEKFDWQGQKQKVLLFPGSVWATKQWTEEGFIQVGQGLSQTCQVVVMGGPAEQKLCERVAQQIPNSISLAGRTSIVESLALIYSSDLVVCNDSASAHLAAIAEVPTIALFGPTILSFGYRPWQNNAWIAQTSSDLKCRPCGSHGHMHCPIKTHVCMTSIPATQVIRFAESILQIPRSL